jgi:glycosyltransferase involved in cell wall biosynthesis
MKILNLNQSTFDQEPLWRQYAVSVTDVDSDWQSKSLITKVFTILSAAADFDVVLFHRDIRIAALFGFVSRLRRHRPKLVYQGYEFDISRGALGRKNLRTFLRDLASRLVHRLALRRLDFAVVHTTAEVKSYSAFFNVPEQKFVFVPYFHYGHDPAATPSGTEPDDSRVLAIGRHRDFDCFIRAAMGASWKKVIVAGESDREALRGKVPGDFVTRFEVSREEYREQIVRASVVVLPFYDDLWKRSLGHIAMFEAILKRKPIVAARTFQLRDYVSDNEILYYRPSDAADLRRQVDRLISDEGLRRRLTENAHKRLLAEFTREKYISSLLGVCRFALEPRATTGLPLVIANTNYDPQV